MRNDDTVASLTLCTPSAMANTIQLPRSRRRSEAGLDSVKPAGDEQVALSLDWRVLNADQHFARFGIAGSESPRGEALQRVTVFRQLDACIGVLLSGSSVAFSVS